MSYVGIVYNQKQLRAHLRQCLSIKDKRCGYLVMGKRDGALVNLLQENGVQEMLPKPPSPEERDRFLKEYIRCIGSIGEEYKAKMWWATDIASKNRFTPRVPNLLQQFLSVSSVVDSDEFDCLILVNPCWAIVSSLQKLLQKKDITLYFPRHSVQKWQELCFQRMRYSASVLYHTIKILFRRRLARRAVQHIIEDRSLRKRQWYVIKTFIYDRSFSQDGTYRDAFFGSLPNFLKQKTPVLLFAVILGNYKKCLELIRTSQSQLIVPLEAFLLPIDILKAMVNVLFSFIKIKKPVYFFDHDVTDLINNELMRTGNGITFYQVLHYSSTKRFLQVFSTRTFLLTYENNPWERMCILALRKYAPLAKIIAYQHTVVHHSAANIFPSQYEKLHAPMPDKIFTVGKVSKDIIERYGDYEKGLVEPACGLRFESFFTTLRIKEKSQPIKRILVPLEGVIEAYKLVNYVLRELKNERQYEICIRPHPALDLGRLMCYFEDSLSALPQVRISSNTSSREDVEWADVVVYWGSTVALEAFILGVPVICYDSGSILNYDPLFECQYLKWAVCEHEPLKQVIDKIEQISKEDFHLLQKKAQAYTQEYIYPINQQCFSQFINS